ncbi:M16 family metallopeptidase [Chondromyces crocatus]|uniref:Peptidase M16 C-terminal domain-containing protein n=1 Tax=Chondromyces crocatus TaxID=52 RepID=A0A0K1ESQ8_CHOCO|nr:insulinase family protein [Chondromyces crocatus]AKT43901.1 uncharacterized protein CMC5_081380 [Chondromyces crocatus]
MGAFHLRQAAALAGFLSLFVAHRTVLAEAGAAPVQVAGASQRRGPMETIELANGLRVVLAEDHRAPVVVLSVVYLAGEQHDPADVPGMGALAMRLLENASTRHVGLGQRESVLKALGVAPWEVNFVHASDYSYAHQVVPREQLELMLWLESDRMGFFLDGVRPKVVESEYAAVVEEALDPANRDVSRELRALVFGAGHPYGPRPRPEVPPPEPRVRAHLQRYFSPANAFLVLAGDFATVEARAMVQRYFGTLASAPRPPQRAPVPPAPRESRAPVRLLGGGESPTVVLAWPTAAFLSEDDVVFDAVARVLETRLRQRFGEGLESRRAGVQQRSLQLGSMFTVSATTRQGLGVEAVQRALEEEVARLRDTDVAEAELQSTRLELLRYTAVQGDVLPHRAWQIVSFVTQGRPADHLGGYLDSYRGVTAASLRRIAARYLTAERCLVALLVSASDLESGPDLDEGFVARVGRN